MENPIKMDDLGGKPPIFWKHPCGTADWRQIIKYQILFKSKPKLHIFGDPGDSNQKPLTFPPNCILGGRNPTHLKKKKRKNKIGSPSSKHPHFRASRKLHLATDLDANPPFLWAGAFNGIPQRMLRQKRPCEKISQKIFCRIAISEIAASAHIDLCVYIYYNIYTRFINMYSFMNIQ